MSVVLVITRNGEGDVWRVPSLKAARLSPIVQLYDIVAASAESLLQSYGRSGCESLGRRAPVGPLGDRIRRHLDAWYAEGGVPSVEMLSSVEELWKLLVSEAREMPSEPSEVVEVIVADRVAMESTAIRLPREETEEFEQVTDENTKDRAPRIHDTMIIHMGHDKDGKKYGKDHNPTRVGSSVYDRFAKYKDGMTVKQAKDAGITPGDIKYHAETNRAFITLKADPKAEAAEKTAAEEKKTADAAKVESKKAADAAKASGDKKPETSAKAA